MSPPIGSARAGLVSQVGDAIPDSVASRETDDSTLSDSGQNGVEIETKSEWPSIGIRVSDNTSNASTAYLEDSNGNNITSISISSTGEYTFDDVNLASNTKYRIVLDNNGSSFTVGYNTAKNYPYTSNDVDITGGIFSDGSPTTDQQPFCIQKVGDVGFS